MTLSVLNNENGKIRKKENSLPRAGTVPGFCTSWPSRVKKTLRINMIINTSRGKLLKTYSQWFLRPLGFICSSYTGCIWKTGTYSKRTTKKKQAKPRVYN